jgi:hypothetical protein
VKVPFRKLALPATPVEPISPSVQPEGSDATVVGWTVREIVVAFDKLPEVPVMARVTVPVVAEPLAVSVNVLVLVVLLGLKDGLTPLGRPVADKLTLPLKPFCGVTVIALVPLAPWAIVKLLGDAESVKFGTGTAFTVRETVVAFDRLPDVPVTVIVTVPVVAVPLAVSVNVLEFTVLVGLKDAVTPLGMPDADRLTLELKPFCGATVMVLIPLAPCATVKLLGDAESVKFAGATAFTVRATVVAFDKLPEAPVIVTVDVPAAAVLLAASVNVLVLVVLLGLNDAVTPPGRPVADRPTLPLKPFCGVTVMVLVPLAPCATVTPPGDADSEKFVGGAIGVLTETLSKVALARAVVLPLVTANPASTLCPMVIVWLVPSGVQFTPSGET